MLTDQSQVPSQLPEDQQSEDERRARVMQALLAQQRAAGGSSGAMGALSQIAQAFASNQMQQNRAENRQNAAAGVKPVSPAFDDSGYPMPRAVGMAKVSPLDAIQNFFMRGNE